MLVIRRRQGEVLLIGDDIEVEILDLGGSQVKLGIRAPKHVSVLRREIRLAAEQNRAASKQKSDATMDSLLNVLKSREGDPISLL